MLKFRDYGLIAAGLGEVVQDVVRSFEAGESPEQSGAVLRTFFGSVCDMDDQSILTQHIRRDGLAFWNEYTEKLYGEDPRQAFDTAADAVEKSAPVIGRRPCDADIVIAACSRLAACVPAALEGKRRWGVKDISVYGAAFLDPLENALQATAPYDDMPKFNTCYQSVFKAWRTVLFSRFVPPAIRFERVEGMLKWAEARRNPPENLVCELNWLKEDANYTPDNRRGYLLSERELGTNDDAYDTGIPLTSDVKPTTMFYMAAGLRGRYPKGDWQNSISAELVQGNYAEMANGLYQLAHALHEEDRANLDFWDGNVNELLEVSMKHAMDLVRRCVVAIDNKTITDNAAKKCVYEAALTATFFDRLNGHPYFDACRTVYTSILRQTSKAGASVDEHEIFWKAAEQYKILLRQSTPQKRMDDIEPLLHWSERGDTQPPLLEAFLGELSQYVKFVDGKRTLVFPDDAPAGSKSHLHLVLGGEPR